MPRAAVGVEVGDLGGGDPVGLALVGPLLAHSVVVALDGGAEAFLRTWESAVRRFPSRVWAVADVRRVWVVLQALGIARQCGMHQAAASTIQSTPLRSDAQLGAAPVAALGIVPALTGTGSRQTTRPHAGERGCPGDAPDGVPCPHAHPVRQWPVLLRLLAQHALDLERLVRRLWQEQTPVSSEQSDPLSPTGTRLAAASVAPVPPQGSPATSPAPARPHIAACRARDHRHCPC